MRSASAPCISGMVGIFRNEKFMPKILVVDDDELCCAYLTALLTRSGYAASRLRNGRALAKTITGERFDAIITDLYMREIDGIEILRDVKRLAPSMPVIGISGGSFFGYRQEAISRAMTVLGASAVLDKPVDGEALLAALRRALEPRGIDRSPAGAESDDRRAPSRRTR